MKLNEAKKVMKIVKSELTKLGKKYKWDSNSIPAIEVAESKQFPGWYGVEVRTDAESYDYFYDNYLGTAEKLQDKIENIINKKMGWRKEEHYFENWGQGIICLY